MDLGALAALSAIAADPAATQTAREFLAQQKLQADRLKAETGMREAELQLQENQARRSMEADYARMGQQQRQFDVEQTRLRGDSALDAQLKREGLAQQKSDADRTYELAKQKLALEKENSFRDYLDSSMRDYISFEKGRGAGGAGIKPVPLDQYAQALGPYAMAFFNPQPEKGEKFGDAKYNARMQQMQNVGRQGYLNYLISTGQNVSPEAAGQSFDEGASFIRMKAQGISDPQERQRFLDAFIKEASSPAVAAQTGAAVSPEVGEKFIRDMSLRIVDNLATGGQFSPAEQSVVAHVWNGITDPTLKAQYLDSVVNAVTAAVGEQKGWDTQQKLEWNGNFRGILDNIITSGEAANFSPYVIDAKPESSPLALPPSRLGPLGKIPQLRAIEALDTGIQMGVKGVVGALTPKEKPKLKAKSRGAEGRY